VPRATAPHVPPVDRRTFGPEMNTKITCRLVSNRFLLIMLLNAFKHFSPASLLPFCTNRVYVFRRHTVMCEKTISPQLKSIPIDSKVSDLVVCLISRDRERRFQKEL